MRVIRPSTRRVLEQLRKDSSNRYYDLYKPPDQVKREASLGLVAVDYASRPVTVSGELGSLLRR